MKILLKPTDFDYRYIKARYPNGTKYETEYTGGDYLNTDYTTFYVDGVEVEVKSHGNYA